MFTDLILPMPLFSFLMALTAGTLIGYALCSPFQIDKNELTSELRELQRQNQLLQGELQRQRELQSRVERNTIDHRADCLRLRKAQEQLASQVCVTQATYREDAAELKSLRSQLDVLKALYRESRSERNRMKLDRDALAAESTSIRNELDQTREQLREARETTTKVRHQREEVLHDLRDAQHERAQVANLLRDARAAAETVALQIAKLREEQADTVVIQQQLTAAQAEVAMLESQRNELNRAYSELRKAHALLQQELAHRQSTIQQLRLQRDQATAAVARQEAIIAGIPLPAGVEFSKCYDSAARTSYEKVA